jgi:hypothetical protein
MSDLSLPRCEKCRQPEYACECEAESDKPAKAQERPTWRLTLRPEPNVDAIRALRSLLKAALRRHGLRCTAVEQVEPHAPRNGRRRARADAPLESQNNSKITVEEVEP